MTPDFEEALLAQRPALLRHCYRLLGCFAEAEDLTQEALERAWKARPAPGAPLPGPRWLTTIATNACLNALEHRRRRALPQLEQDPAGADFALGETDPERWITPAPDRALFPDPGQAAEARQTVALAFVALLQRVAPRQRAALVLKDVLGWSAEEVAQALELTVPAVHSALHRAREAVARAGARAEEPTAEQVQAFVRAWETRDLEGLVALLRRDITLAMPPHPVWFSGLEGLLRFLRTPRFAAFWASLLRLEPTRANGLPAFAFVRRGADGAEARHSIMVVRFLGGQAAEMTTFVGPSNFAGFAFPAPPTERFQGARLS